MPKFPDEIWALVFQHLHVQDLVNIGDTCRRFANLSRDYTWITQAAVFSEAPWVEPNDDIKLDTWHKCARFVARQQLVARLTCNEDIEEILSTETELASEKDPTYEFLDVTAVDKLPADFEPIFGHKMPLGSSNMEIDMKSLVLEAKLEEKEDLKLYHTLGFDEEHTTKYENTTGVLLVSKAEDLKGALVPKRNGSLDVDNVYMIQFEQVCGDVQALPSVFLVLLLTEDSANISYIDYTNRTLVPVIPWLSEANPWFTALQYHGYIWIGLNDHFLPFFCDTHTTKVHFASDRALSEAHDDFAQVTEGRDKRYFSYGELDGAFYDMATSTCYCFEFPTTPKSGNFFAGYTKGKLQLLRITPERVSDLEEQYARKGPGDVSGMILT